MQTICLCIHQQWKGSDGDREREEGKKRKKLQENKRRWWADEKLLFAVYIMLLYFGVRFLGAYDKWKRMKMLSRNILSSGSVAALCLLLCCSLVLGFHMVDTFTRMVQRIHTQTTMIHVTPFFFLLFITPKHSITLYRWISFLYRYVKKGLNKLACTKKWDARFRLCECYFWHVIRSIA